MRQSSKLMNVHSSLDFIFLGGVQFGYGGGSSLYLNFSGGVQSKKTPCISCFTELNFNLWGRLEWLPGYEVAEIPGTTAVSLAEPDSGEQLLLQLLPHGLNPPQLYQQLPEE